MPIWLKFPFFKGLNTGSLVKSAFFVYKAATSFGILEAKPFGSCEKTNQEVYPLW